MSKKPNWRHYHLEKDGNRLNSREQRYSRAWLLVARLAKREPACTWRVVECDFPTCHQVPEAAIAYRY